MWKRLYLESCYIDNSVIMCDEIIDAEATSYEEETKTISTNFNEKNVICKTKSFYILLASLLITITLLLKAVDIYFCLKKYKAKQKHLLSYYVKIDKSINVLQMWTVMMN